jgi:hypothetical protein
VKKRKRISRRSTGLNERLQNTYDPTTKNKVLEIIPANRGFKQKGKGSDSTTTKRAGTEKRKRGIMSAKGMLTEQLQKKITKMVRIHIA